ncbi:hypothetical protein VTO73DRAFT_14116 [Trametes versicolor]
MPLQSRLFPATPMPLDIISEICSYADFRVLLLSVAPASHAMREMVSAELLLRHKKVFEKFANNPQAFRSLLRRHKAAITGAVVLQMFCPQFSDIDHYDVHVPLRALDDVLDHLLLIENYTVLEDNKIASSPVEVGHSCSHPALLYRSGIARLVVLQRGARLVHVIASGTDSITDCATLPLGFSWSTLFFNYISADAVRCAYPQLTFNGRGLWHWDRVLHRSFPEGTNPIELNKYGELGFALQRWADEWDMDASGTVRSCDHSWCCPLLPRTFVDRGSFGLVLGTSKTSELDIRWVFGGRPCPDVCHHTAPVVPYVHSPQCPRAS